MGEIDDLRNTLAKIMLGENNAGVDTLYTLEMYKEKIKEINLNLELKNKIKELLTSVCNGWDLSATLYRLDITIMAQSLGGQILTKENYGAFNRKYIYLIPVGEFQNFLTLIGIDAECSAKLLKIRKDNERHLGLSSMFGSKKDITGTSIGPQMGGRKTRRQKKSKRSRKSKRRRHRKMRK